MQVQDQIPKGIVHRVIKGVQVVVKDTKKALRTPSPQLIVRVFECDDVMCIAGNAFGLFPSWKHVLTHVNHCEVLIMGVFGN